MPCYTKHIQQQNINKGLYINQSQQRKYDNDFFFNIKYTTFQYNLRTICINRYLLSLKTNQINSHRFRIIKLTELNETMSLPFQITLKLHNTF